MKIYRVQKNSGCILEVVEFSNGLVTACWQTGVPEVATYQNIEQFMKVRTPERGYTVLDNPLGEIDTQVLIDELRRRYYFVCAD